MTFIFVSGAGADSTGQGRVMWARVKGETENEVLRLPFNAAYIFRPAFIQPLHGSPLKPVLKALAPRYVTTTERIGRAMIRVARQGASKPVLESRDIDLLGD